MIAYKFLRDDGTSVFTGYRWNLPDPAPGPWVRAEIDPCRSGIHACRVSDLPLWVGRNLYEVELEGEIVEEPSKVIASRGRLLRLVDVWDDDARAAYTRMCADRAHELARQGGEPLEEWEAVVEPSVPEGPALLGFVAARIAEVRSGPAGYAAEREHQSRWLAERLQLQP